MPLRLLEVTVPKAERERIPTLLRDFRVVHVWPSEATGTAAGVRILLEAEDAEALSDLMVRHFGSHKDFRLILLPVEATLPAIARPSKAEAAGVATAESVSRGPRRISREELYEDIAQASRLTGTYVIMVGLSTVVAAVGLIRGDVAIVIGAMVIAPLLGPNIALSLAATLGDLELTRHSLRAIAAGVTTAATLSFLLGVVLHVDPAAAELAARTRAEGGDIVLALAAGTAGALAFTSGVPAVVVGVMVAVALLPPLVVAGLLAGAGHLSLSVGALLLASTNVTCINLAAVATFLLQRVRPRTWWEAERARSATLIAVATWIAMLVALFVLIQWGNLGTI